MHIFFSVGEPSGDQHAAQLMHSIKRRHPQAEFSGFGGPLMDDAGCRRIYPLTELAVMGIFQILPHLWTFYKLVQQARRYLEQHQPDAVVLIDYPGFNWWIARKAKAVGIPVYYYMPPQLWAWAPWRIRKVRKFVDHVLSGLRFETDWYHERGIPVTYVGHPFFDEVAEHPLDEAFCESITTAGLRNVAIMPGSRTQEVTRNFPVQLEIMRRIHDAHPDVRFRVACYKPSQQEFCERHRLKHDPSLPLHFYRGKTSEIIETAECCLMVSGSVSLEVLARTTPAVVIYHANPITFCIGKVLITCKYLTLPNLMSGWELMPEFPFGWNREKFTVRMTGILNDWLADEDRRQAIIGKMRQLRDDVVDVGGVERAAEVICDGLSPKQAISHAA